MLPADDKQLAHDKMTTDHPSPHRWQRLQTLYDEAMTMATAQRPQFVIDSCADDKLLRDQLLSLVLQNDGSVVDKTGFAKRSPATLEPGHVIGRYRVIRQLGAGGMGSVYLGERADSEFHQQVAIKLVNSDLVSPNIIARMRGERQILANLNHPNIARLIDGGGTAEGLPYLVMEYIEGTRIDLYCSTRKLDINGRLQLFKQVCSAVHAAHQQLIIHRDIKPSNILVTTEGVPKLLDFGIAKLLDANTRISDTALTHINERMLTPEYASPEQIRGEPLSTASDVYALGILLYELLTGTRPYRFKGTTLHQLEQFVQSHTPLKPSAVIQQLCRAADKPVDAALSRSLRGDLDNIILKAMHKDVAQRYSSVDALADDVDNYLANRPISARPDSLNYVFRKFWQRNRWSVSFAATMVLVIVVLTIFYTWRLTTERDIAQRERLTATRVSDFMTEVFRVANPNESRGSAIPVREVLDAAVTRIDKDLNREPEVQIALLRKMAQAYVGIGLWNEARVLLERAVKLTPVSSPKEQLDLADTYTELASVEHRLADFKAERSALERALQIRGALHQDRDSAALPLLTAWAKNLATRGNVSDATQTLLAAEKIAQDTSPSRSLALGKVYSTHGDILFNANRYNEAEQYYRKASPLLRNTLDQGADPYLDNAIALGGTLISQARLEEAQQFMTDLLKELVPLYPSNHPLIAAAWNELGIAYCDSGMYDKCSDAFQRSTDIEQQLSPQSMRTAMMYANLGSAYRDAGKLNAALNALSKSISLFISLRGRNDPNLMGPYYEQAAALRLEGNLSAADRALQAGEQILVQSSDTDNPTRYFLQLERGRWLIAAGKSAQAAVKLQTALNDTPKEAKRLLANIHLALGQALLNSGKCVSAINEITSAFDIRRAVLPKQNWYIYEAGNELANAFSRCGKLEAANALYTESIQQLRSLRSQSDVYLSIAEKNLRAHEQRTRNMTR